jgi:hypothetical protein
MHPLRGVPHFFIDATSRKIMTVMLARAWQRSQIFVDIDLRRRRVERDRGVDMTVAQSTSVVPERAAGSGAAVNYFSSSFRMSSVPMISRRLSRSAFALAAASREAQIFFVKGSTRSSNPSRAAMFL